MDEWNFWYGDYIYGEQGVRYHHKDALGIAKALHEYFRNSDMYFMVNYTQTVNVIGCIKTTKTESGFAATGLPLMLYRNHFETLPVKIDFSDDDLDVAEAVSEDKESISIGFVNSSSEEKHVRLNFKNSDIDKQARLWQIQHNNPDAFNVPGREQELAIDEKEFY
jgi:alpha-N-arabinofuranosidase